MNTQPPLVKVVLAGFAWLSLTTTAALYAIPHSDSSRLQVWIKKGISEHRLLNKVYLENRSTITRQLEVLDHRLQSGEPISCEEGYHILYEKLRLEKHLHILDEEAELKAVRMRYQKSIEMLKMLYEKILSMDHHFSSLKTHQQVLRISNPHEYQDFKEVKIMLEERMKKKSGFALPPFMESNPYLSAVFSIAGLTLGTESKVNREQLDRIACILDFTVRMHHDLSLIYFEAGYLQEANLALKQACETLFAENVRPLGYPSSMNACRESDDWERLYALLDQYAASGNDGMEKQRAQMHLRFAIDRVVRFIDRYSAFVLQSMEYYKKFARITAGYSNEQTCASALPEQFRQLQADIRITLDKFRSAYNLPEIQGSRLKDLLYGQVE